MFTESYHQHDGHTQRHPEELEGEADRLREELKEMAAQLRARDEYLNNVGTRMLSFGNDGKPGKWTRRKNKYIEQVSGVGKPQQEAGTGTGRDAIVV